VIEKTILKNKNKLNNNSIVYLFIQKYNNYDRVSVFLNRKNIHLLMIEFFFDVTNSLNLSLMAVRYYDRLFRSDNQHL